MAYINTRNVSVLLVLSIVFVLGAGFLTDSQASFQKATQEEVGEVQDFSLLSSLSAVQECSDSSYPNCYFTENSYEDAYAFASARSSNLPFLKSGEDTFLVSKDEGISYECSGSDFWVGEYTSNPIDSWSSSGVEAVDSLERVDRSGRIPFDEYDGSNGLMVVCADHDITNGFWTGTSTWIKWTETIDVNKKPVITDLRVPSEVERNEVFKVEVDVSDPNQLSETSIEWSNGDFGGGEFYKFSETGERSVRVSVSDEEYTVSESVSVSVVESNNPPVIESLSVPQNVEAGERFSVSVNAVDSDGDDLSYSWSNGDSGVNGSYRFLEPGNYSVGVTVSDGELEVSESSTVEVVEESGEETGFFGGLLDLFKSFF